MLSANPLEKRRQVAGICVVLGLVIEALCLIWASPIAFVIFVAVGGLLMFAVSFCTCTPWSPISKCQNESLCGNENREKASATGRRRFGQNRIICRGYPWHQRKESQRLGSRGPVFWTNGCV